MEVVLKKNNIIDAIKSIISDEGERIRLSFIVMFLLLKYYKTIF